MARALRARDGMADPVVVALVIVALWLMIAEHAAGVDKVLEAATGTEQQGIQVYRGKLRLAGLALAVPALLLGLRTSEVVGAGSGGVVGASVGSSILFAALAKVTLGRGLEAEHLVSLSPLAFAGWLGLLVTALNLLPIGQLDGGHVARSLLGHRAGQALGTAAMWSLLLLAFFVWPGLLVWAVVVFFLAGRGAPPLEDVTPLDSSRRRLGFATFALLVLLLLPLPHDLWPLAGIHCPYL